MKTVSITMSPEVCQLIEGAAKMQPLEVLEENLLDNPFSGFQLSKNAAWQAFEHRVREAWKVQSHIVVRGIPVDNGTSSLLSALVLRSRYKSYRGRKIVKKFKMSPWTTELSQTIKEGHFHTDLNTAPKPPAATVIHCIKPDPQPGSGETRIVLLPDLLGELKRRNAEDTLRLLMETDVEMVDDRKHGSWSGKIVQNKEIRFHPETLRAAVRRSAAMPKDLEEHLALIHESALAVSSPIQLDRGDAVFVSNLRALHYRGPCTARYIDFPRNFDSREIYVFHLLDEPQWSN